MGERSWRVVERERKETKKGGGGHFIIYIYAFTFKMVVRPLIHVSLEHVPDIWSKSCLMAMLSHVGVADVSKEIHECWILVD